VSFWTELRRRNVLRAGAVYLAGAWVASQVGDVVAQAFDAPSWPMRMLLVLLALGLPVALSLAWLFELTPDGVKLTRDVDAAASTAVITGRRLDRVLIGMIGLLIVVLLVDNWLLPSRAPAPVAEAADVPATTAASSRAAAEPPREVLSNSVAVLPFENLSPDPDNAFFAAGLHEEILNQLAKISALNVIARTSVLRYATGGTPIAEIARDLNVQSVMEGSVRYAGDRIRVTAQLIDPVTGAHLWSETYDRRFEDVFAVESDIAMNVANALRAEFTPEEQARIERIPTHSPEAYALYLRAAQPGGGGVEASARVALLDESLALDPMFADAHGLKAATLANQLVNQTGGRAVGAAERAGRLAAIETHAKTALALDPDASYAYLALGNAAMFSWRWREALEHYERVRGAMGAAGGGAFPVMLNSYLGRYDSAADLARRALVLDPNVPSGHLYLAWSAGYARDYAAAAGHLRAFIEQAPTASLGRLWLAYMEVAQGNGDAALQSLESAQRLMSSAEPWARFVAAPEVAYTYARLGRPEDARRVFDDIQELLDVQELGAGGRAMAYLAIGDQAEALRWLSVGAEKVRAHEIDEGFFNLMNLRMNYLDDPVLEQPEFVAAREALTPAD
jgi:TolB-like protein